MTLKRDDRMVPEEPVDEGIGSDTLGRGVVITLDNGKCALYSSDFCTERSRKPKN